MIVVHFHTFALKREEGEKRKKEKMAGGHVCKSTGVCAAKYEQMVQSHAIALDWTILPAFPLPGFLAVLSKQLKSSIRSSPQVEVRFTYFGTLPSVSRNNSF